MQASKHSLNGVVYLLQGQRESVGGGSVRYKPLREIENAGGIALQRQPIVRD